ncbi:MAG: hypothetical protein U1F15_08005 [Burkholderiales bacterium]
MSIGLRRGILIAAIALSGLGNAAAAHDELFVANCCGSGGSLYLRGQPMEMSLRFAN